MSKEVFIKKYLETNNKESYSLPIYLNRFDGNSNFKYYWRQWRFRRV